MLVLDIVYLLLLGLTILVVGIRKKNFPAVRLLFILLLIKLAIESTAFVLKLVDENNLFLFHILTPVEYLLYSLIFYKAVLNRKIGRLILFSNLLVFAIALVSALRIEGLETNNSYAGVASNILLVAWCIVYLAQTITDERSPVFSGNPLFWLSIGLLFYNSGNLFTLGPLNYLMESDMSLAVVIYSFSYLFSYTYFLAIIFGIIYSYKKLKR